MVTAGIGGVKPPLLLSSYLASRRAAQAKIVDTTLINSTPLVNAKFPAPGSAGARQGDVSRPRGAGALGSRGATFPPPLSEAGKSSADREPLLVASSAVPRRWSLLHKIQRLCRPRDGGRGPAVCGCGAPAREAESVSIHLRAVGDRMTPTAGVSGVYRCRSPWLCPVCSAASAHVRAERVQRATDVVYARGGAAATVVLTASHRLTTPLADVRRLVAGASRRARQGRAWGRVAAAHGILGVIVGKEVTVSPVHGWHYHQHLAVLVDGRDGEDDEATRARAQAAGEAVAERYRDAIRSAGGTVSDAHGCRVRVADDATDAARYMSKGSSAWEVAGGHKGETKAADSLTPWDLAESAARVLTEKSEASDDARWARARWAEYVAEMPGTRSCVVSPSLAAALGLEPADEEDEEEGAQVLHESDSVVGRVPASASKIWTSFGFAAAFLARIECGGEAGFGEAVEATEADVAALARRSPKARQALDMLTPDAPSAACSSLLDPAAVAARAAAATARAADRRADAIRIAATRIVADPAAGTLDRIRRAVDDVTAAVPDLPPPTCAEIVAAMRAAA